MDDETAAVARLRALFAGPIDDPYQLLIAVALLVCSDADGWAGIRRKDLQAACRISSRALHDKLKRMVEQALVEERKHPRPGLRLSRRALGWGAPEAPLDRRHLPIDRHQAPMSDAGDRRHTPIDRHHAPMSDAGDRHHTPIDRRHAPMSGLPAYLPDKDIKTNNFKEEVDRGGGGGTAAPRQRRPSENRPLRIPPDWEPDARQLDRLAVDHAIPVAFSRQLVWEFRQYWSDRGASRHSWAATFASHARNQWKREQANDRQARESERWVGPDGRRISQSTAAMRRILDSVARAPAGIWDGDPDDAF